MDQEEQDLKIMKKLKKQTVIRVDELPQILQDMINGKYREDLRYDPYISIPKRQKSI